MSNIYHSLRETFSSDPIVNAVLSSFATPPADFTIFDLDTTSQFLYSSSGSGSVFPPIKFDKSDKPRILGVGLFSNLADGLVYQDDPDTFNSGIGISMVLKAFDDANNPMADIGNSVNFRLPELNQIFETDHLFDVSSTAPLYADPTFDSLRIQAFFGGGSMKFTTISIDPAYAAKRLIIRPVVVIEHTFPLTFVAP